MPSYEVEFQLNIQGRITTNGSSLEDAERRVKRLSLEELEDKASFLEKDFESCEASDASF